MKKISPRLIEVDIKMGIDPGYALLRVCVLVTDTRMPSVYSETRLLGLVRIFLLL